MRLTIDNAAAYKKREGNEDNDASDKSAHQTSKVAPRMVVSYLITILPDHPLTPIFAAASFNDISLDLSVSYQLIRWQQHSPDRRLSLLAVRPASCTSGQVCCIRRCRPVPHL